MLTIGESEFDELNESFLSRKPGFIQQHDPESKRLKIKDKFQYIP